MNFIEYAEPQTYEEAVSGPNSEEWKAAIQEELSSLHKNQTWHLEPLPEDKNVVGCKWIFKIKNTSLEEIPSFKAHLCTKGFTQKNGIDYQEIFSPVVQRN